MHLFAAFGSPRPTGQRKVGTTGFAGHLQCVRVQHGRFNVAPGEDVGDFGNQEGWDGAFSNTGLHFVPVVGCLPNTEGGGVLPWAAAQQPDKPVRLS